MNLNLKFEILEDLIKGWDFHSLLDGNYYFSKGDNRIYWKLSENLSDTQINEEHFYNSIKHQIQKELK